MIVTETIFCIGKSCKGCRKCNLVIQENSSFQETDTAFLMQLYKSESEIYYFYFKADQDDDEK